MVLDISDDSFKNILNDETLYLPIAWDGMDFSATLEKLLLHYMQKLQSLSQESDALPYGISVDTDTISEVCQYLIEAVNHYLNGFPSKAYTSFKRVMRPLMETPLKIYQKSISDLNGEHTRYYGNNDTLRLFRAVKVEDKKTYARSRVFHTPYTLRSKVSTNRYSIAGYPSLYLGTSLELCCEEVHINPAQDFALASMFKLERRFEYNHTNIRVVELGVKPQDFLDRNDNIETGNRNVSQSLLTDNAVRSAYLLWYPLIASCSYITAHKNDPFAVEYIIPQLLMQWVRNQVKVRENHESDQLIGIRYFSCASEAASEMGFNYVFPTSNKVLSDDFPYCSVLANAFRLTNPVYIHEYNNLYNCEHQIESMADFEFITSETGEING